jgi:FlaA1/EpsC-like NDP-sugar epimerase
MIRLSGFAESDIRIEFTGLRPGEKLFEEPLADAEKTLATPHPKLRIARVHAPRGSDFLGEVDAWLARPADSGASGVRARLQAWIPEYRPATTSR